MSEAIMPVQQLIAMGLMVSPDKELTLTQQAAFSGISAANLLRRWKKDPEIWGTVIYTVGKNHSEFRTTMALINECRERASSKGRKVLGLARPKSGS